MKKFEPFELHAVKCEDGGMSIDVEGSVEDTMCCLAYLIESFAKIMNMDKVEMVSLALTLLQIANPIAKQSIIRKDVIENAYRHMKGET